MRGFLATLTAVCILAISAPVYSFPDAEITGITGGPPLNLSFTDNPTSFITKDNGTLIVTYGQVMRIVDLGIFALAATQPIDTSADDDDDNDSPFNAAFYDNAGDQVLISQERGYVAIYSLADLGEDPVYGEVLEGKSLGPLVVNETGTTAYITNNTDRTIHIFDIGSRTVSNTITVGDLPNGQSSYNFTAGIFVNISAEAYFATDKGGVIVLPDGGTAVTIIDVATSNGDTLAGMDVLPDDSFVYVTNKTDISIAKIEVSSRTVNKTIDLNETRLPAGTAGNTALDGIVITAVTNPTSTYAYVAGGEGVTVIDTINNDDILDMVTGGDDDEPLPVSATPKRMAAGSDGYVYMDLATTEIGIISENPWVTVSEPTYSGGGSSLGAGETFDITFQANKDGTYELRTGGDVDASGSVLTDINGDTSGNVVADTDVAVTIPYDENSALFAEGNNSVHVFVTDTNSNLGRNGTTVSVDTPPDVITLRSTGFGNTRVYVTFERLTAEDMDHYNVYVDPDPDEVLVKAEVGAVVSQPGSGSNVTGHASGLTNGTLYYIAVEGVDADGNVGATRANTLPDGSLASAMPEITVGPAGFSGESGCTLVPTKFSVSLFFIIALALPLITILSLRGARNCHCERSEAISIVKRLKRDCFTRLRRARNDNACRPPRDDKRTFVPRVSCFVFRLIIAGILLGTLLFQSSDVLAKDPSPQRWSFEIKSGFWIPSSETSKVFFGNCCSIITRMQGGLLIHGRYGIEQGVGFMYRSGRAVGVTSGQRSEDSFNLITIPMETNFAWRLDYFKWRYLIPYFKAGLDYTYFREDVQGDTTQDIKWGAHGVGGLMISFSEISDDVKMLDKDMGLNDMHLTLEAQYQWINNFGGGGLNLGGWLFSAGLLFVF